LPEDEKPRTWQATELETYARCPRAYRVGVVENKAPRRRTRDIVQEAIGRHLGDALSDKPIGETRAAVEQTLDELLLAAPWGRRRSVKRVPHMLADTMYVLAHLHTYEFPP
jgi:hypothetical protein